MVRERDAYSKILSVLYKLLLLATVSYCRKMGGMGRPRRLIISAEGCGVCGASRLFLMMTTVMPVDPRFFCAPKKMSEYFLTSTFRDRMFELISATTMGPLPSGPGARL